MKLCKAQSWFNSTTVPGDWTQWYLIKSFLITTFIVDKAAPGRGRITDLSTESFHELWILVWKKLGISRVIHNGFHKTFPCYFSMKKMGISRVIDKGFSGNFSLLFQIEKSEV